MATEDNDPNRDSHMVNAFRSATPTTTTPSYSVHLCEAHERMEASSSTGRAGPAVDATNRTGQGRACSLGEPFRSPSR